LVTSYVETVGVQIKKISPPAGIRIPDNPARTVVAIPTELSQLLENTRNP